MKTMQRASVLRLAAGDSKITIRNVIVGKAYAAYTASALRSGLL